MTVIKIGIAPQEKIRERVMAIAKGDLKPGWSIALGTSLAVLWLALLSEAVYELVVVICVKLIDVQRKQLRVCFVEQQQLRVVVVVVELFVVIHIHQLSIELGFILELVVVVSLQLGIIQREQFRVVSSSSATRAHRPRHPGPDRHRPVVLRRQVDGRHPGVPHGAPQRRLCAVA